MASGGDDQEDLFSSTDPSLAGNFRCICDKEFTLELRNAEEPDEASGAVLLFKMKVMVQTTGDKVDAIRVDLTNEDDIFFYYRHACDEASFREIQAQQKLTCTFSDYHGIVLRCVNKVVKEPSVTMAVLYLSPKERTARVDFIQNMEYKFLELLAINFKECPTDVMHKMANFRYQSMKKKMLHYSKQLEDVCFFIKNKNPSMLIQMKKSGLGVLPFSGSEELGSNKSGGKKI